MEFQLLDRMSFQHFAGLKHSGRVPDRNTIWCFHERLVQANVEHQICAEAQLQLQAQGSQAREGQIIDASIVRTPTQHNTADEQVRGEGAGDASRVGDQPSAGKRMSRHAGRRSTASRTSATTCRGAWIAGTS
ncbi:transposase [Pseudomonas sp. OF001]|uniref:transposase n=1 Tax=Pseudomonas sp. OF001 TaxID=2772300 RepID=UPI002E27FA50|nr:transposase [Pseudomonas sp. OF001]